MSVQLSGGLGLRQLDVNKTVMLLKLTDSALKSLERFQDRPPSDRSLKPLMEFKGTQGVRKLTIYIVGF